jgi:hypothetical protein
MWRKRRGSILAVLAVVCIAAVFVLIRDQHAPAQTSAVGDPTPRYSVIETQAHNLIVTDNKSNVLYFYTIDKDKEVGTDLKLRGTIDLKDVGKPVITPVRVNPER